MTGNRNILKLLKATVVIFSVILLLKSCAKDPIITIASCDGCIDSSRLVYDDTPYPLIIPTGLGQMPIPESNPLTQAKVDLGRKLFYDPILSGDSSQSCSSCHKQELSFTDGKTFSEGIDGSIGTRNSMAIVNLGWSKDFFWDGRSPQLEDQALEPVTNPIEMHDTWPNVIEKVLRHPMYPYEFYAAFGTLDIDSTHVSKALASFMRIIISGNSKYDLVRADNPPNLELLTPQERAGYQIYISEQGDCFHCHGDPYLTDHDFHNNGLDSDASLQDSGLFLVTGNPSDLGRFKSPTLRNIEVTGPYMHDSRFETLEEVVVHYSFGLEESSTIDP
ncbi:MAG: cytochrome-c peroxidase, partial [Flavobacteriales bacterium]|nr:cytochrome-c peroxidase [Flavobacteriales bacterium]